MLIDPIAENDFSSNQVLGNCIPCEAHFASNTAPATIGCSRGSEHCPKIDSDAAAFHATNPHEDGGKYFHSFLHSVIGVAKVRRIFPLLGFVLNSAVETPFPVC